MPCNCTPCKNDQAPIKLAPPPTTDPDNPEPSTKPPVPNELLPIPPQSPQCFMPQPQDILVEPPKEGNMGPIGPWATGKLDWNPLAGITGTRPIVDKYSITRYSEGEWRKRNFDMLDGASKKQHYMDQVEHNGRNCLREIQTETDKFSENVNNKLKAREQELHKWKTEVQHEIEAMSEEIKFVEEQRKRLQQASEVLLLPESIAGESLEQRTGRLDLELVRDEVEEELIKELAMIAEIRESFTRTLKDVEKQLNEDKIAKQRLEYDWGDKKTAHEIESFNLSLHNNSRNLQFKPGSVVFSHEQSSIEYWDHFTQETLREAGKTRLKSADFRTTLDSILTNAARDLRTQAQKVDLALSKRVSCTMELVKILEDELKKLLQKLADVETLKIDIMDAIRRMDMPLKKAHTRLNQRLIRPRVENCRDDPHYALIEEVKLINQNVTVLQNQLQLAETAQADLIKTRNDMEREILMKRKTLEIDIGKVQKCRSFYPSASALSGY